MFSIFGAKHSPLMLDANSLNFFLQEKNQNSGVGNPRDCCSCCNDLCPPRDQRTGLANCFAAFLPSQVCVACYNSGLCSLQWPFLQDGAKPSDTGPRRAWTLLIQLGLSAARVWRPQLPLGHNHQKQSLGCSGHSGLGTLLC